MERYNNIISLTGQSSVALGCFDAMHIGHSAVLSAAFSDWDGRRAAFTARSPAKESSPIWLPDDHARLMAEAGAEFWITPDFDSIRGMSPEEFVHQILADKLMAKRVACGYDFRFGHNASGTAETLRRLTKERGIKCVVVPEVRLGTESVSTTAVRRMLASGDIERVNAMLGRRYGYTLPVVEGEKLGRTLGAPTINQQFSSMPHPPRFGVYASRALIDGAWMYSVTNFGMRPTIGDVGAICPISETWVPEFTGNLYGKKIRIEWIKLIRDEKKFDSLDALRTAIFADAELARKAYNADNSIY